MEKSKGKMILGEEKRVWFRFDRLKDGKRHCLTFSYNDGAAEDERLVGIFNRYGLKATFHLNSGILDTHQHIRSEQVKELYHGHEVACHSLSHPYPDKIPIAAWTQGGGWTD